MQQVAPQQQQAVAVGYCLLVTGSIATCAPPDLLLKHLDKHLKHTFENK
jgi:hypothetical protein